MARSYIRATGPRYRPVRSRPERVWVKRRLRPRHRELHGVVSNETMAGALTMVGEALDLEFAGDPGSIALARAAAREFADTCGADADSLALAVSEAVTNAIVHGYRG